MENRGLTAYFRNSYTIPKAKLGQYTIGSLTRMYVTNIPLPTYLLHHRTSKTARSRPGTPENKATPTHAPPALGNPGNIQQGSSC